MFIADHVHFQLSISGLLREEFANIDIKNSFQYMIE